MAKTNEQIDALNEFRKDRGEEPLPYETNDNSAINNNNNVDADKLKADQDTADAETERLRIEAENKANEGTKPEDKKVDTPSATELTKEQQEEIVKKYLGITDLNEVVKKSEIKKDPTPEEIEAAREQRENEKIAYALKSGKFSRKQYESFIADAKDPISLVLTQYSQEQKALDPTLTNEEIETEFNSKFGLDTAEDSRQHKRGLKEIGLLAENILKQNYENIYKLDSEFDSYENQQLTQKQLSEKLISEAPVYKAAVEEIYTGLKKVPIDLGNGEKYEVEFPDEIINSFKERELNTEYAASQIKAGYTKEQKAEAAKMAMVFENLPFFIKQVADKINYKRQAGAKGIPNLDGQGKQPEPKKLTQEQQEQVDRIYGRTLPVAN